MSRKLVVNFVHEISMECAVRGDFRVAEQLQMGDAVHPTINFFGFIDANGAERLVRLEHIQSMVCFDVPVVKG